MVSAFDPKGERDLVFIPVGLNFDRTLEDRSLVRDLNPSKAPCSLSYRIVTLLRFVAHQLYLALKQRWYRFGYACVNFGSPISMRDYTTAHGIDFRSLDKDSRFKVVEQLGAELCHAISEVVPVLPVPLVASVFVANPEEALSELDVKARSQRLIDTLEKRGAYVHIPRADRITPSPQVSVC